MTRNPAERLAFMASDSGMSVLVTQAAGWCRPFHGAMLLVDEPDEPGGLGLFDRPEPGPSPTEQTAYVIYTSAPLAFERRDIHHGGLATAQAKRDVLAPVPSDRVRNSPHSASTPAFSN